MKYMSTPTHTLAESHMDRLTHISAPTCTHSLTDSEHEVVERLFVEVAEGDFHSQGEVCQVGEVLPALNQ